MLTNLIKTVSLKDHTGGATTKELVIYHNENIIPTVIGTYIKSDDILSVTKEYRAGNIKILEITQEYFRVAYTRITSNGSYLIFISYTCYLENILNI